MKRLLIAVLLLAMVVPFVVQAKVDKFTFPDVEFADGTVGELEAGSKLSKNATFTTCSYFSDGYVTYLGYYESDAFASDNADEVLAFCLEHFNERETH